MCIFYFVIFCSRKRMHNFEICGKIAETTLYLRGLILIYFRKDCPARKIKVRNSRLVYFILSFHFIIFRIVNPVWASKKKFIYICLYCFSSKNVICNTKEKKNDKKSKVRPVSFSEWKKNKRERGGGENEGVREIERERKKRKKYWNIIWSK